MADETSSKGVWIEQDENGREVAVVESQPERGVQLVGEGGLLTPDVKARIEAAKDAVAGVVRGGPEPVSNETVKGKTSK